ncbi:sigma factor [Lentzea sp. DG1S-22]|uniref:RNA polymerase sigma factor n=1 Tax=Lentzea sp. DG1S-22 TaxID=3108822 RepID=UPI002E75A603|nr:sigma factor [Lentzea sp. DG1S-22]WVH83540.1 sigma factor [Lentzea sp. DG1S-22]
MRSDVAPVALKPETRPPAVLDEAALLALYETTAERLHRYVARRAGADTAQDVVSEAFLVLWDQRAGQVYEADAVRAWLYGVATNLLRGHVGAEERKLRAWSKEHAARTDEADIGDRASVAADAEVLAHFDDFTEMIIDPDDGGHIGRRETVAADLPRDRGGVEKGTVRRDHRGRQLPGRPITRNLEVAHPQRDVQL